MNLEFSEEQQMLRSAVRDVCERHSPPSVIREMEDHDRGYPDELWSTLADMDLLGLTIPEEYGGSGQSPLENAILYEEFGRSLAPTPHLVSCVIGAGLIAAVGSNDQRDALLPAIASGETILSAAWLEPDGGFGPEGVQLTAKREADTYLVTGTKLHVPFANSADQLLTLVRSGPGPAEIDLLLVDTSQGGLEMNRLLTMAGDPQFEVVFEEVAVPAENRLGKERVGWQLWKDVMDDVLIAVAANCVGGARRAFEMAMEYSKQREQFGRPIGSFQAIAHYLADVATAVEGATTLVYEAAWGRAENHGPGHLPAMAKLYACDVFREATAVGQQIYGGIGFIKDVDMQLYFRRAKQLQLSWWDAAYLEELIAKAHLDAADPVRLDPIGWGT